MDLVSFLLLIVAVTVFAICCWSRQWLLYPNYNYLSWSPDFPCSVLSSSPCNMEFTNPINIKQESVQRGNHGLQCNYQQGLGRLPAIFWGSCLGGVYSSQSGITRGHYKDDMNRKYLCVLLNVLVHSCARRRSANPRIFLSSTTWNLPPSPYPLPLISDQYCPFQINTVCEV